MAATPTEKGRDGPQQNHRDKFLAEYLQNQSSIFRFIMSLVPHADEADELLQQVSMTLWERWDDFDPQRGDFIRWAVGIARNHVRNHVRQRAIRNAHVIFDAEIVEQLAQTRVEHHSRYDDRGDALAACLQRLPPGNAAVVQAFYGRTTTVHEMARSYGMSPRSLNRFVERVRRALLECVNRRLEERAS